MALLSLLRSISHSLKYLDSKSLCGDGVSLQFKWIFEPLVFPLEQLWEGKLCSRLENRK